MAVHLYAANRDMTDRYFVDSDGELLLVPELGAVILHTELGPLRVSPGEIAVIPRGIRFRVEVTGRARPRLRCARTSARTSRCPSAARSAPTAWPTSATSCTPHAAFEERDHTVQVVNKFGGNLWAADYDHSPLDVVAWHGNYAPYKYDTASFMVIGTISFDHPDPSIFTVLTSPTDTPGLANCDFVIFAPRWLVGEDTFRPPWFHRNIMSEFMGLVTGHVRRQGGGLRPRRRLPAQHVRQPRPGRGHLRAGVHRRARAAEARRHAGVHVRKPLDDHADQAGMEAGFRQRDYDAVWSGLSRNFR